MVLVIEMIVCCALFSVMVISGTKKNPLSGLHNMPVALQERVAALDQYQNVQVVHTKERILKKLPALVILAVIFVLLIYTSGARSFTGGFVNTFLLWLLHEKHSQKPDSRAYRSSAGRTGNRSDLSRRSYERQ